MGLRIPVSLRKRIRETGKKQGIKPSALVRTAVEQYLERAA